MTVIVRSESGEVAGFEEAGIVEPTENPSGDKLDQWLRYGVPGLRGRISGDDVIDEESIIKPDEPLFGLALLEHFEDIGWTTADEFQVQNYSVLDINTFCPTGPGGGVDPTCSPGSSEGRLKLPPEPTFISSKTGNVEENKKAIAEMKALAESSSFADHYALETHPATPSPKVQAYKQALIAAVKEHETASKLPDISKLENLYKTKPVESMSSAGSPNIPDPSQLTFVKNLPGSTGPKLMEDKNGKQYVVKTKISNQGHIVSEALADELYRKLGVDVPDSNLFKNSDGSVSKVSEFHNGHTLAVLDKSTAEVVKSDMSQHFVADALMANWDVVGLGKDNILLSGDKVLRIDNGGALRYRAQGDLKPDFGAEVKELDTMRNASYNAQTADVFKNITDSEINKQIKDILPKRKAFLEAIKDEPLKQIMAARFDSLKNRLEKSTGIVYVPPEKTITKPEPTPPSTVKPGEIGQMLVDHITSKSSVAFTPLQLEKIKVLNPNGLEDGVFKVTFSTSSTKKEEYKAKKEAQLAELKKILPAGTKIKIVTGSAKTLGVKQAGYENKQEYDITHGKGKGESSVTHGGEVKNTKNTSVTGAQHAAMKTWIDNMTSAERSAVASWKGGNQSSIKKAVASGDPNHSYADKAKQFMSAIEKAPTYTGEAYRGMHANDWVKQQMELIKKEGVGSIWSDNTPHGLSLNAEISTSFSGGDVLLRIQTKSAKMIIDHHGYESEKEVIGLPGTKYRVVGIMENTKVWSPKHNHSKKVKMFVDLEEI